MLLSYRGCQYQKDFATSAYRPHSIEIKYRGVNDILEKGEPKIAQLNSLLKYRGVAYQLGGNSLAPQPATKFPFNSALA